MNPDKKKSEGAGWRPLSMVLAFVCVALAVLAAFLFQGRQVGPKIGVVDNQTILAQFSESIRAQKAMEAQQEQWNTNLKAIKDSLQGVMDRLSSGYEKAGDRERKAMQQDMEHWNREYNRYMSATEKMRAEKQKELLAPVLDKVNGFIKMWAQKNGYQVIIGTGTGGVVMSVAEGYNVTSRVLEDLNKMYGGTAADSTRDDQLSKAK